jgi:hypothetical protein
MTSGNLYLRINDLPIEDQQRVKKLYSNRIYYGEYDGTNIYFIERFNLVDFNILKQSFRKSITYDIRTDPEAPDIYYIFIKLKRGTE